MKSQRNTLPGVLGKLDLDRLKHNGRFYGAFRELLQLLEGSSPELLDGVNLGNATDNIQRVVGGKIPSHIACTLATAINEANFLLIKKAVLGDEAMKLEETNRKKHVRAEKKRLENMRANYNGTLPRNDTDIDWTGKRPMKAPASLLNVDPMSITAVRRISIRHVKGGGVKWKSRITDNWGRTATLTGNADTLACTRSGPLVPDKIIRMLQGALEKGKTIGYVPDTSDSKSRRLTMERIEKRAYRLYRRHYIAQHVDALRHEAELADMAKIPSEAFQHIVEKYVTEIFDDRSGRWISMLKPYDC